MWDLAMVSAPSAPGDPGGARCDTCVEARRGYRRGISTSTLPGWPYCCRGQPADPHQGSTHPRHREQRLFRMRRRLLRARPHPRHSQGDRGRPGVADPGVRRHPPGTAGADTRRHLPPHPGHTHHAGHSGHNARVAPAEQDAGAGGGGPGGIPAGARVRGVRPAVRFASCGNRRSAGPGSAGGPACDQPEPAGRCRCPGAPARPATGADPRQHRSGRSLRWPAQQVPSSRRWRSAAISSQSGIPTGGPAPAAGTWTRAPACSWTSPARWSHTGGPASAALPARGSRCAPTRRTNRLSPARPTRAAWCGRGTSHRPVSDPTIPSGTGAMALSVPKNLSALV